MISVFSVSQRRCVSEGCAAAGVAARASQSQHSMIDTAVPILAIPPLRSPRLVNSCVLSATRPIHRGGHAKHAHEGAGGLFVAGGNGAPLFEPCPKTFDPIAVVVDPERPGDLNLVGFAGIAGPAPWFQMRSRKAWLAYPW